jgi:hypothetical protein
MFLQSVDQRCGELVINCVLLSNQDKPMVQCKTIKMVVKKSLKTSLEVVIHPAPHSVCLKAQVHILAVSMVDIVLVQDIIQTLIEILQVEENNCTSCLHANLDLVDVPTDLQNALFQAWDVLSHMKPLAYLSVLLVLGEAAPKQYVWLDIPGWLLSRNRYPHITAQVVLA